MQFAIGFTAGVFAGGVLSYLYAAAAISTFKTEAAKAGVFFQKIEGKWQAVRKAL
jgi:hypothetical protein